MSDQLTINPAGPDQAELIADLSRSTFYDTFAADNTAEDMDLFMNEQFTKASLEAEVGKEGLAFFIAWLGTDPVGYLKLNSLPGRADFLPGATNPIELSRIYTVKHCIGKGVGAGLLKKAFDFAQAHQHDWIWLGVWEKNTRAIGFYRHHGFERVGQQVFILGNDPQTDWIMARQVNC
ncbi:GNAT family N-acetyltransferase [Flavihumibacter rivuli]|uniref:GNAT family N-acetyltransferase n=1 Tax=Flavihumibacter rivuli TaxID=2838156 RepID=UPI001BDE38CA|nr:GNAT family N-acetyltransferase [Flavihumibacter rivuli]ULQ57512.1 GNAT family N-acetyltransferase [Flavihumibacter rivuli]